MNTSIEPVGTTITSPRALRTSRRWIGVALVAPAVVTLLLLAVVPTALVVRNSFAVADNYGGIVGGFTMDNYRGLIDPVYLKVLGYNLSVATMTTFFCLVVGYLASSYVVSRPPRRQGLILLLIVVPFWTDLLVRTFAWINLLADHGPIVSLARTAGLVERSTPWVPSQGALIAGLLYAFLPAAIFPIYAAMRGIDGSLRDAAADLGCDWWNMQRRVLVPLCRRGLAAAAVLTFIPTFGVFVIPVLLGGGKDQLIGNLVITLYTEFRNQPMGAAVATILLLLMLVALGLAAVVLRPSLARKFT